MVPLLRTKHTYSRSSYPAASSSLPLLLQLGSPVFLRTSFAVAYFSASWCKRACKLVQSQDRRRWSRTLGFLVCPVARSWVCISQKSCHGTTVPWTRCHRSLAFSSLTNSPGPRMYRVPTLCTAKPQWTFVLILSLSLFFFIGEICVIIVYG